MSINNLTVFKAKDFEFNPNIESLSYCFDSSKKYIVFPSFCDVHVHFREPGFFYKESIKTGTLAAAHGGYTDVCTMPNLNPVPDTLENLQVQLDKIKESACIHVYPYASITMREAGLELAKMEEMADYVIAFSDDGKGVQSDDLMRQAMLEAKRLNKMIVAHCEDNRLLFGGYIHDGRYAKEHHHKGICSESEWKPIQRDLELVKETGCAYHVCHISCKESVELIRQAKKEGLNVTCETAPHYLILDEDSLQEDGRFKMNPPLRTSEDRKALMEGILDGTIDMIATDHAPHSEEEKSRGLEKSPFGITGIELAFPLLYTYLVKENRITLEKLIELLVVHPRKRFNIPYSQDYTIWDLEACVQVKPEMFLSKGTSTPFMGENLYGECVMTVCENQIVYQK